MPERVVLPAVSQVTSERSTTAESAIAETTFISDPQRTQSSGATSKMRRSSHGQQAREARSAGGVGAGSGGGAALPPRALAARSPRVRLGYQA